MFEELNKIKWDNLLENIDTVLLDADGCLWDRESTIKQAPDAVKDLIQTKNKRVILVTNNASLSTKICVEKCQRLGFGNSFDETNVVTTAHLLGDYLKRYPNKNFDNDQKVFPFINRGMRQEFDKHGLNYVDVDVQEHSGEPEDGLHDCTNFIEPKELDLDPDVATVAVPGFLMRSDWSHLNVEVFLTALRYLLNPHVRLVVTNEGLFSATPPPCPGCGKSWPDTGCIVSALKAATGREPEILLGKPSRYLFNYLTQNYQIEANRTLMIGDSYETDVKFARDNGMHSICVLSGSSRKDELEEFYDQHFWSYVPDYYVESLGAVANF